jgi:hypothetical protein
MLAGGAVVVALGTPVFADKQPPVLIGVTSMVTSGGHVTFFRWLQPNEPLILRICVDKYFSGLDIKHRVCANYDKTAHGLENASFERAIAPDFQDINSGNAVSFAIFIRDTIPPGTVDLVIRHHVVCAATSQAMPGVPALLSCTAAATEP